jgi:prefoldin subunit 2
MSELAVAAAPAPAAPAADADPLKGEPTPESQQDVIRIFNGFKRDAQMIISKVSELQYEIGEHELVMANATDLPDDRNAYRLVGGVLVKTTVGDALPKVKQNMNNISETIKKLQTALASVNAKSAAWKEKYGIKTQQEMELEKRAAQASGGPVASAQGVLA